MICHVCRQPASGQCKSCLRFYCPQHGNLVCSACSGVTADAPAARDPAPDVEPEPDLPSIRKDVVRGATCHLCAETASRACRRCGRFYCERHGSTMFGPQCETCARSVTTAVAILLSAIVCMLAVGFLMLVR
jgi:hypothetical protein